MTAPTTSMPRRRPRAIGLLVAAAVVVAGSYLVTAFRSTEPARSATTAAPAVGSATGSLVDGGAAPVGSIAQIDHSIEAWSKNLGANPQDFLAATNLATLWHGRGRLSSDLTDYERGLAAARSALGIEPLHAPARALEASILFSLHEFQSAFSAADALVRDDPAQVGALATRFDAALELGRIDTARADLERLAPVGGPAVLIRQARLASVTEDPQVALERATAARSAAIADDVGDLGFYAYAVGEYARLAGDAATARAGYADALEIRSGDLAALIGLARIDAFEGRIDAAVDGSRRAIAIAPQPEALALLGDLLALRAPADPEAADAYDTVRFIERLGDLRTATYDRQLVRFELDHGGASADVLARANDSLARRPDWSGQDTVAWALYRLGRYEEAAASIDVARSLGADDARLRFHEGAIRMSRGDAAAGTRLLRSALDLGPALERIERAEAARLLGG
jgi:tetratricopeptide (TPR) repeat protein